VLKTVAIVVFGFLLLVAQSTFAAVVPMDLIVPNAALAVVIYMGLHGYSAGYGAVVSFVLGYLMDTFAGSPLGLYTFVAVAIFLLSRIAALRLFLKGWLFEIALTLFWAAASGVLVLLVRGLFDQDFRSLLTQLKIVFFRAAATAVVAPLVFRVMAWLERVTAKRKAEGRAFHG
jgi:rod shape-determining protein MreD